MANRILVIDDEEPLRMLLTDLLEGEGYEVITASNGVEGVRKTFADVPDAVLTDIMMPDMDGLSYLKRVRSQIKARSLPVIVVSALGLEENIVQAFRAGATDYLVKPFRHAELLARIQVALKQKAAGDRIDPFNLVLGEQEEDPKMPEVIKDGSVLDMGKYRILSEIGSGGMGTVYLARHLGYGIDVALKVLKPEMMRDRKNILRFLREVRIATQMNHPHIVQVFDLGLSGDCYYYALEILPQHSLFRVVRDHGALDESTAVAVGIQLSSALVHMHSQGFMHRDVKPDNILFVTDKQVKLIDFGLACALDDSRLTQEGSFIGTPGFVAPENIQEYRDPDLPGDIYSLGATLYFAASGMSPFAGKGGPTQRLTAQVEENPPPPTEVNPNVSPRFSEIMLKMLERDPQRRYSVIDQVHDELVELRENLLVNNNS